MTTEMKKLTPSLFFLIPLFCSILGSSGADQRFSCYTCYDCPQPFEASGARPVDDCLSCGILDIYNEKELIRTSRTCLGECVESNSTVNGLTHVKRCCWSYLCNNGTRDASTIFNMLLPATISIIYSYFH